MLNWRLIFDLKAKHLAEKDWRRPSYYYHYIIIIVIIIIIFERLVLRCVSKSSTHLAEPRMRIRYVWVGFGCVSQRDGYSGQ